MAAWLCSNGAKAKLLQIVYPGGHVELHDGPVRAAEIMLRNPKFCLTHSQSRSASRQPWAIVSPETTLMLGRKYYLILQETSVGKILHHKPATATAAATGAKDSGDSDSDCFSGGNCIMCFRSSESCEEELEGKRMKRRSGVFSENGKKKQFEFGSSSENWEPSLNSITEEY